MKIILSFVFLFYTTVIFGQSAESVLKSLQNKFDSIYDLSADINQNSGEGTRQNSTVTSGKGVPLVCEALRA